MQKISLSFVFVLSFLIISNSALAHEATVYFMTGFPVDIQPAAVTDAEKQLQAALEASHLDVQMKVFHQSLWQDVCNEIKADYSSAKPSLGKIVFVGHSYGAQASVDISKCVGKNGINVLLVVSMDMVQKPFFPSPQIIPENVKFNDNFYEADDATLAGIQDTHRGDRSYRGVTNTLVPTPAGSYPHWAMITVLFTAHTVQDDVISKLNLLF